MRILNSAGWIAVLFGVELVASVGAAESLSPADLEFFEKRIRPVLAAKCWDCHSKENAESELRLDSRAATLKGGTRGPALVPKDEKTSLLILAINHADQLHMPPKSKLPQREIDDLTDWVKRGAFWPGESSDAATVTSKPSAGKPITDEDRRFWSFTPIVRPASPPAADGEHVANPIDRFVVGKLKAAGLALSSEADKRTLIRRATLDLHGLPPTPDEVAEFLADESPAAFERLLDRLLASPRYGVRWGRHWLDVVRYGDSNGLDENLAYASAWRYRDYVIDAWNDDLPYDQFLAEQVAGDLMPSDDPEAFRRRIVATGFLSLGAKMLAEDDPVKMEMDIIDEQVDTIGKAFLGMTLGCARCHDHKFDPIPTADYYSLAGIFKSTKVMDNFNVVARWQERPLATTEELGARDAAAAVVETHRKNVDSLLNAERDRLLAEVRAKTALYMLAAEREARRNGRPPAVDQAPDGDLARLPGARVIEAENFDRGNVAKDFGGYGQGIGVLVNRGETPNFVEYDIEIPAAGDYQLDLRYAAADRRPCRLSINRIVVKKDAAGEVTGSWTPETQQWHFEGVFRLNQGKNVLRLQHPQFFPHIDKVLLVPAVDSKDDLIAVAPEEVRLIPEVVTRWRHVLTSKESPFSTWRHAAKWGRPDQPKVGDWSGFDRDSDPLSESLLAEAVPATLSELAARYQQLLTANPLRPMPAMDEVLKSLQKEEQDKKPGGPWSRGGIPETLVAVPVQSAVASARHEMAEAEKRVPKFDEAMAASEGTPTKLRVHLRGSHVTLGAETQRRFPTLFDRGRDPVIGEKESGRRQLAQWLAAPENPLTARVMANRLWLHHFGEGLVRSPDNFGRLGETPTHPELLDWLAAEFRSSPDDATNPLRWSLKRMHRRILSSATWKQRSDLNSKASERDPENKLWWRMPPRRLEAESIRDSLLFVGGSLDESFGGSLLPTKNRAYVTSTANVNPAIYVSNRRTVYLPVVRSAVYDFLVAFDFGDPSTMNGKRDRTTVAPQALFLMNSPLVTEQSRMLAKRLLESASTDDDRIWALFERLLSRTPTGAEKSKTRQFVERYVAALREGAGGPGGTEEERRLRAWQAVCRALMGSNEFLSLH